MKHEYIVVNSPTVDIGGLTFSRGDILCSCEIGLFARFLVRNNEASLICPTKAKLAACLPIEADSQGNHLEEELIIPRLPNCLSTMASKS